MKTILARLWCWWYCDHLYPRGGRIMRLAPSDPDALRLMVRYPDRYERHFAECPRQFPGLWL